MAIFTRRNIQKMLDEIAPFLELNQLKTLVEKLNHPEKVPIPSEWEVALLWALSKFGDVKHEPAVGDGKPDIVFNDADPLAAGFVADIVTVSDSGLDKKNPVDEFCERFWAIRLKRQMPGRGFHYRIGRHEQPVKGQIVKLPPKGQMNRVFNSDFHRFLSEVQADPSIPNCFAIQTEEIDVTIQYDPERKNAGGSMPGYKSAHELQRNPIYNNLSDKRGQVKKLQHDGAVVIFLCDGDCEILRQERPLTYEAYALEQIVWEFLRQNKSISGIAVLSTHMDHRLPVGAWNRKPYLNLRCFENPMARFPLSEETKTIIAQVGSVMPGLARDAMNATRWYRGKNGHAGVPLGGSKWDPGTHELTFPARQIAEFLAGRISLEEFSEAHHYGKKLGTGTMPNPFELYLSQGRTLISARVEKCDDKDDDWIVFQFGKPDPSISPFVVPEKHKDQ